jgi:2-hydroxychromene-2-carboxylate isomerase
MRTGRRDLLILGGIIAAVYGLRALPWGRVFGPAPEYTPVEGLAPFRALKGTAALSTPEPALLGLGQADGDLAARQRRAEDVKKDPCTALFGFRPAADVVPMAYFGDVRCVACRGLERDLEKLLSDAQGRGVQLVQHELPIFGQASEFAARASIAAARQGKRAELRQRFVRRPILPDESALRAIAAELDLNADQLLRDMASDETTQALNRSRALADIFGFVGTPALVVGRTTILGAVSPQVLGQVIREERALGPVSC